LHVSVRVYVCVFMLRACVWHCKRVCICMYVCLCVFVYVCVWQPTPLFLPEKFHRQRSLVGYSPWGHKELDTIEHVCMHTHTHITSNGLKHYTHINLITHKFLKRKRGECLVYFCGEMLEGTLERRDRATTEGRRDQGKVMILWDINITMNHWCKKDFWRLLKQEEIWKVKKKNITAFQ